MTATQAFFAAQNRRAFLRNGSLFLLAAGAAGELLAADSDAPELRIGLITDLHYADIPTKGTRFYRETLSKLEVAAEQFKTERPKFIVELGDLIDNGSGPEEDLKFLKRVNDSFAAISPNCHYLLGNHCVQILTKEEFLGGIERKQSYYSFDEGNYHFVVLDACFTSAGVPYQRNNFKWDDCFIPPAELDWLAADLKANAQKKTIVFAHQRLDNIAQYAPKNAAEVRKCFEAAGNVLAVFQGHSHKNDYQNIAGIHYCTLVAMVEGSGAENNAYTTLDILPGNVLRLTGFKKQKSYRWS
jgi:UDP-2,3-diacylglucosamine pyrophosphatase LpxH